MTGPNVVPFGKYKGHPVENMLADHEYMTWVEAQPWFRDRYLHLLSRRDAETASRTPVHNRLQTLFLNEDYQRAFLAVASSKYAALPNRAASAYAIAAAAVAASEIKLTASIQSLRDILAQDNPRHGGWYNQCREDDLKKQSDMSENQKLLLASFLEAGAAISSKLSVLFETSGVDVYLTFIGSFSKLYPAMCEGGYWSPCHVRQIEEQIRCPIEIKPTVADEYPAILRQMERNKSSYLFVENYAAEGATENQFVSIFAASGRRIVFKRDVDRAVAEHMLLLLDEAGVQLSIQPSGKITIFPGTAAPEVLTRARAHRDAITALLIERSSSPKPPASVVEEDTL